MISVLTWEGGCKGSGLWRCFCWAIEPDFKFDSMKIMSASISTLKSPENFRSASLPDMIPITIGPGSISRRM